MSTTEITVRPADPSDAEAVSEILAASYGDLYRGWYSDETLHAVLPAMTRAKPELLASGAYYLAIDGDRPIACGGWSPGAQGDGSRRSALGHIRHFATHPDHLRKGAASALMDECVRTATAAGVAEFECLSSLPAEPFYLSQGFRTERFETIRMRSGFSFAAVLMRRPMATARRSRWG
ncbi:MAG: GNAT family N-acetyltransferase [Pseudomonadota bacterium]